METFGTCDNRLKVTNDQLQGIRGELKSTLLPAIHSRLERLLTLISLPKPPSRQFESPLSH
jgi:hypothetical protein